jgi:peptide/nickel transport system substrate-binding protein
MGSGPFIFVKEEWQPGNKVVYRRNPDYVPRKEPADFLSGGKIAHLERVEWRTMPDANTTYSALVSGEIDYFEVPPLDFVNLAEKNPDLKVQVFDAVGLHGFIRPNFLQPPFNDVRARQALAMLVDQENFMRAAVGNPSLYKKCFSFFMCGSPNETDIGSEPYRTPNVARAKELLKEAGYKGETLSIITPSQAELPVFFSLAQYLGQTLTNAGIPNKTEVLDWASFVARRSNKGPVAEGGWNLFCSFQGGPDTSVPAQNYWFNAAAGASAQGWPSDETLEKLTSEYSMQRDPQKRRALVDQIQKRGYEYLPLILLGQFLQPIITRKNVTGVLPASQAVYWNIRKT